MLLMKSEVFCWSSQSPTELVDCLVWSRLFIRNQTLELSQQTHWQQLVPKNWISSSDAVRPRSRTAIASWLGARSVAWVAESCNKTSAYHIYCMFAESAL